MKATNKSTKGMWKRTLKLYTKFKVPWHLYIISVIVGAVSAKLTMLYVPYLSEMQTGNIQQEGVVIGYLGFTLLSVIISIVDRIPEFYASAMVNRNLQNRLIDKSLRMPFISYEKNASQIVSWITYDCSCAHGLISSVVGFITGMVTAVMSIMEMTVIDQTMAFIVPFVVIYVIFSTWLEGKLMFLRERRGRRAKAELTAYLAEHLGFFTQIKQLHSGKEEMIRGKKAVNNYYRADIYQSVLTLIDGVVSGSIGSIINILVFVLGVPKVREGAMDLTQLVQFQSYILIAYNSLSLLPGIYTSFMYSNGQLFYVAGLMDEPEEDYKNGRTMDIPDEDIAFRNVSFSYGEKPVIKNASFTVPKGKVTVIAGPNGAGKTTLFKLIERFYTPDSGSIKFGEYDAKDMLLPEWRQSFTYVLQEPRLFNGTVAENITYGMGREVTQEEIAAAAKLAGADEFINELPEGYNFEIGDNGDRLSAGQRQRIAIARAVMLDPAYLLLDEATCNLDVYSEQKVKEALSRLMEGRTTLMITHDMSNLKSADNIIVLNDGEVEACGDYDTALANSETLRQLVAASA